MKIHHLIFFLAGVSACAHREVAVESIPGPSGEMIYEADCGGAGRSFGDCMRAAAKTCNGRYEVIDKDAQSSFYSFHRGEVSPIIERYMLFRCVGAAVPPKSEETPAVKDDQPNK